MKLMKLVELPSTGAALTSRFHQFVGGKTGSGLGTGPPSHGGPGGLGQVGVWPSAALAQTAVTTSSGASALLRVAHGLELHRLHVGRADGEVRDRRLRQDGPGRAVVDELRRPRP